MLTIVRRMGAVINMKFNRNEVNGEGNSGKKAIARIGFVLLNYPVLEL